MDIAENELPKTEAAAPTPRWFVIALLILCGLSYWYRMEHMRPGARELLPSADAREYGEVARRIAFFQGVGLRLGDGVYPSRYPIGFSVLLSPAARLFAADATKYPIFTVLLGVISIALAGILAVRLIPPWAALFSASLVAFSSLHQFWSQVVMSDVPSMMLMQLALILIWGCRDRPLPTARALGLGLILGLLATTRLVNIAVYWPLLLFILTGPRRHWPSFGGVCLGAAPLLILECVQRVLTLGGVFQNGYAYWVPRLADGRLQTFSFSRILSVDPTSQGPSRGLSTLKMYGPDLLGLAENWIPSVPVLTLCLAVTGVITLLIRHKGSTRQFLVLCLLLPALFNLLVALTYYWLDKRFLFPLMPLQVLAVAAGFAWVISRLPNDPQVRLPVTSLTMLIFLVVGVDYHGLTMLKPRRGSLALEQLAPVIAELEPGAVVSNVSLIAVRNVILADGRERVPIYPSIAETKNDIHVNRLGTGLVHRGDPSALKFVADRDGIHSEITDEIKERAGDGPIIVIHSSNDRFLDLPALLSALGAKDSAPDRSFGEVSVFVIR